jgi:hypothetical protein
MQFCPAVYGNDLKRAGIISVVASLNAFQSVQSASQVPFGRVRQSRYYQSGVP